MYKIVCYLDQEVKINMRVITHQGGLFLQCVVGRSVGQSVSTKFEWKLDLGTK